MRCELRSALPDDALEVAQVHVRAWQAGYAGLLPAEFLAALDPREWAPHYAFDVESPSTKVAVVDGAIVGLVTCATHRGVGELCVLYVDPEWWGNGIGAAMLAAATQRLSDAGFSAAELWVMRGNTRATRFYRAHGWLPTGRSRNEQVRGVTVSEECYVRRW